MTRHKDYYDRCLWDPDQSPPPPPQPKPSSIRTVPIEHDKDSFFGIKFDDETSTTITPTTNTG